MQGLSTTRDATAAGAGWCSACAPGITCITSTNIVFAPTANPKGATPVRLRCRKSGIIPSQHNNTNTCTEENGERVWCLGTRNPRDTGG